jgi:hypothetical protein
MVSVDDGRMTIMHRETQEKTTRPRPYLRLSAVRDAQSIQAQEQEENDRVNLLNSD